MGLQGAGGAIGGVDMELPENPFAVGRGEVNDSLAVEEAKSALTGPFRVPGQDPFEGNGK